jgi:hypothetical protein
MEILITRDPSGILISPRTSTDTRNSEATVTKAIAKRIISVFRKKASVKTREIISKNVDSSGTIIWDNQDTTPRESLVIDRILEINNFIREERDYATTIYSQIARV